MSIFILVFFEHTILIDFLMNNFRKHVTNIILLVKLNYEVAWTLSIMKKNLI